MPSQVVLICGEMVPWFHASPPAGSLKHDLPQLAGPLDSQKLGLPNISIVGVRLGSPVTMCRIPISTGSAM